LARHRGISRSPRSATAITAWPRSRSAAAVFSWAASQGRWLLIENVKDFRPILLRALHADTSTAGILYTSNRAFPRSRKNPGPLIQSIHFRMLNGPPEPPLTEDWLLSTEGRQPTLAAG
jgi:hypothetical protein